MRLLSPIGKSTVKAATGGTRYQNTTCFIAWYPGPYVTSIPKRAYKPCLGAARICVAWSGASVASTRPAMSAENVALNIWRVLLLLLLEGALVRPELSFTVIHPSYLHCVAHGDLLTGRTISSTGLYL